MTISAVVPAAGCGVRAALNGNKILAPLHRGQPVLYWTFQALLSASLAEQVRGAELIEFVVAARPEEFSAIEAIWHSCHDDRRLIFAEGGATRQESVFNAVRAAHGIADGFFAFVGHDVFVVQIRIGKRGER